MSTLTGCAGRAVGTRQPPPDGGARLAHWQAALARLAPGRRAEVGWRAGSGIDDW